MTIAGFKDCIRPYAMKLLWQMEMFNQFGSGVCTDPPFDIEEFLDCIVFECIYRVYCEDAPKNSVRRHMINNGEEYDEPAHTQVTRSMKKARQNREERFGQLKRIHGLEPEELLNWASFSSMRERKEGYSLTGEQFRQLKNMERLSILKKIDTRQVCDNKHYSNEDLISDVTDYEKHFENVFSSVQTSEDYIHAAIELFSIEAHYCIEFVYMLSAALSEKDEQEVPIEAIGLLCNAAHPAKGILTDSRFVVNRLKLIPAILDAGNWDVVRTKIDRYLTVKIFLFHCDIRDIIESAEDKSESLVQYFSRNVNCEEQARFISDDYMIKEIIHTKEWNKKQIQYFRRIYESVIRTKEKRKQDIAIADSWQGKS